MTKAKCIFCDNGERLIPDVIDAINESIRENQGKENLPKACELCIKMSLAKIFHNHLLDFSFGLES